MKKKSIFVFGYWSTNVGDDIFLKILCKRYPKKRFIISTNKKNAQVFRDIPNLKILQKNKFIEFMDRVLEKIFHITTQDLYAMLYSSVCVEIGGSIFMDRPNWQVDFDRRKFDQHFSDNYFVIGSNFGPSFHDEFIKKYQQLLDNCKVVFRDTQSKVKLGLDGVSVAPDVIFGINEYIPVETLKSKFSNKYLVITTLDLRHRPELAKYSKAFDHKIYKITQYYLRKGYQVILTAFCAREGDEEDANRIYEKLTDIEKKDAHVFVHQNINETLGVIANAELIIAVRFHATILGLNYRVPVLPIIYSEKTSNVLTDIDKWGGNPGIKIKDFINYDIAELSDRLLCLDNQTLAYLQKESKNQFQYLDKINE